MRESLCAGALLAAVLFLVLAPGPRSDTRRMNVLSVALLTIVRRSVAGIPGVEAFPNLRRKAHLAAP